ncbi:glycoside hydrolase domain-containing protein, partial [Bacteroidota bacterium]
SRYVEFPEGHDLHFKAPYFLDVRAGEIESIEPLSLPLVAWSVDPLVKVFQQDIVPADPNEQVNVYAARNSRKSFQVALRSLEERDVEIQITALKNSNGVELPVPEISKVGYVKVDYPNGYYFMPKHSDYIRFSPETPGTDGWCDLWPDPLIPVDNNSICKLQANSTQPVWFDVNVPENTAPGIYKGQVIIKSDVKDIYVPVEVKVWNLLLPESRHTSVIYDLRRNLDEKIWYSFLAQYNISPGYIRVQPKFTYENGQVSMDADEYDEQVQFLIDELHNTMLYSPSLFRSVGWFTGAKPIFGLQPFSPEYVKAYKDAYRLFIDHITEKGWRKNFVTYLSDEPRIPLAFDAIARVADMAREVAPDVPIYVSSWRYIEEIEGHITAWGIGAKGTFPAEIMEERQKEGDSFIYTTDGEQCLDAPFPAIERLMPWFCFKYGVRAYEFWGSTVWSYNPWEYGWHAFLDLTWEERNPVRYPNGDGYIIYPGEVIGHPGPVASIRIVAVREGVDDYEIFHALNRYAEEGNSDAKKALDRVRSLVVTPHRRGFYATKVMPDPIAVSEARVSAGEVLDRLLGK